MLALRRSATGLRAIALPASKQQFLCPDAMRLRASFPSHASRIVRSRLQSRFLSHSRRQLAPSTANAVKEQPEQEQGLPVRFEDLLERGQVSQELVNTLTKSLGFSEMTEVQSMTIDTALKGGDVLAQARTGTGKTMGFLLPVVQRILDKSPALLQPTRRGSYRSRAANDIRAIIISPTRELAEQIATEAVKLVRGTGIKVQTAVGGTQKRLHLQKMLNEGCHLLVGTPGRLKDILSDEYSNVSAPELDALVLDEADRLLDDGFWTEIQEIQRFLPDRRVHDRQVLMFSATIPKEIVGLVRQVMKPDLHFVRTVKGDEVPTHERVKQVAVAVKGFENMLPTLVELCQREITTRAAQPDAKPFKALIYFNTTSEVNLYSSMMRQLRRSHFGNINIYMISSQLTQAQRTHAAESFRKDPRSILISSDVTARGMDFPDVSHVIQMSFPNNRDTYIHRIGRTGRAGKEGEAWILYPQELERSQLFNRLEDLPIKQDRTLSCAMATLEPESEDMDPSASTSFSSSSSSSSNDPVQAILTAIRATADRTSPADKAEAWKSTLNLNSQLGIRPQPLYASMSRMGKVILGFRRMPPLNPFMIQRIGLSGVPGVEVQERDSGGFRDRGFSRRGAERNERGSSSEYGGIEQFAFGDRNGRGGRDRRGGDRGRSRGGFGGASRGRGGSGGGFERGFARR